MRSSLKLWEFVYTHIGDFQKKFDSHVTDGEHNLKCRAAEHSFACIGGQLRLK